MKLRKKEKTKQNRLKDEIIFLYNKAIHQILSSFLVLIIFFVVIDIYQYLITEYWWLKDKIDYVHSTLFLLFLIFIISYLPIKKLLNKNQKLRYLIITLFLLTILGHQKYSNYYNKLQRYPKIKKINKDWGVPWSWIKINGRNFGDEWEAGMVYLGESETIIKKWTANEIIFEITDKTELGKQELIIVNSENNKQEEKVLFEVKQHAN